MLPAALTDDAPCRFFLIAGTCARAVSVYCANLRAILADVEPITVWLRECVYKRITPKNQKPGFQSSIITFMTSALWVRRMQASDLRSP